MINLVKDTIDSSDIDKLIEWLKTYPRLTKGQLTLEFEKDWCKYLGVNYSTYVNSGSSANLLALYCLLEMERIKKNDIECRPLICGSMARQPFFIKKTGIEGALPNADVIHYNGCYVPNHQSMTEEDVLKICKIINEI